MKMRRNFAAAVAIACFVLASVLVAAADPPSRVARLQYVSGEISVQPGGVDDWVEASVNRPLTTADRIWADKDSRAELHLGGALMRINAETSITLSNVGDETVQVELDQGTLNLRVRHLYDGEIYEVDTPNVAFTISKSGEYRFDVDPDGDTTLVTVWKGRGEATGDDRAVTVKRGQQVRFSGGNSLAHQVFDDPDRDGFDDWCRVRDRRLEESQSARYVSPDVIGAEDLDDYGTWRVVPTYGAVWVPAVAPGWAPYHDGRWVWVEPWGWTWVDDAPWGFAPCHYGRWIYYRGYWGWVPGPVAVRPVYAPALVAWVGGSNWGIAVTSGEPVGWFPLGYGEPYIPPYGVSRNYFQNVNTSNTRITNITNVTNNYYNTTNVTNVNVTNVRYVNRTVPGAVTAVPRNAMVTSQSVARASIQVPPGQLRRAPIATAPSVAPERESVLGSRTNRPGVIPPARVQPRAVVSRVAPPARPIPFEAKKEALERHPGRPLDRDAEEQIRARIGRQPANPAARGNAQAAVPQENNAGRRQDDGRAVGRPAQPTSNIRVNGRVEMPAPDRSANVPDRDTAGHRQASPGHSVPRPPQRGPQHVEPVADTPSQTPARPVRPSAGNDARPERPGIARPPQTRTADEEQPQRRPVARPPQDRPRDGEGDSRPASNAAPVVNRGPQRVQGPEERPAVQPSSVQERSVPRPPQRDNNSSRSRGAPVAQPGDDSASDRVATTPRARQDSVSDREPATPQRHQDSVPDQPRGNSNSSAPRPTAAAEQPTRNAAPEQPRRTQPEASPAPSVRQTGYVERPASRPAQPESRPEASAPSSHGSPAHESKPASSHSDEHGKPGQDKH